MKNVLEYWPLYDTVLIGNFAWSEYPNAGFFAQYANMGAVSDVPFFSIRNRSMVGIPYNNMDQKESVPFPYHCQSIGVELITPFTETNEVLGIPEVSDLFFGKTLANHSAIKFVVSQDVKFLCTLPLSPGGMGVCGDSDDGSADDHQNGILDVANNGSASLVNRWIFPEPVLIPRNTPFSVVLSFSDYARNALQTFQGNHPNQQYVGDGEQWSSTAAIRISLFGLREVQQRGQLHFR